MLISRKIKAHEHERFIAFNQHNSGVEVTTAYLKNAQARIFVRSNAPDQWIAAYVVNTQPPYRCLSVLDDSERDEVLSAKNLSANSFVEITLLNRDRSIRWNFVERYQYYVMGIWDALKSGYPYLLGGTSNPRLLRDQMAVFDQILYEGELNFFGQQKKVWLIYVSRNRAIRNLAKHLWEQLWQTTRPTAPV
ncbi:MAG: hypothetical protein EAZ91_18965 [Cytophagales bacterium]|nr:MAG: hypothetical protein EAZ91_18965 [Cytophagales bacterium]